MSLVSYCCVPRASIRFGLAGLASKEFSLSREREESCYFYDHGTEIELSLLELEREEELYFYDHEKVVVMQYKKFKCLHLYFNAIRRVTGETTTHSASDVTRTNPKP